MSEGYEYDKDGWPARCPSCQEPGTVFSPRYQNQGAKLPPLLSAYYQAPFACSACGSVFRLPYPQPHERAS